MLIVGGCVMVNRRISRRMAFLLLIGLLMALCDCTGPLNSSGEPEATTLCEILAAPRSYSGKTVLVTASVAVTREGSLIWQDGCDNSWVGLQFNEPLRSDHDLADLLVHYRASNRPLTASMVGTFRYGWLRRERLLSVSSIREIRSGTTRLYPTK